MKFETRILRAAVRSAVESVILLIIVIVTGPLALAILDAVRLAAGVRNSPNILG